MKNKIYQKILNIRILYAVFGKYYFKKYNFIKIRKISIEAGWGILTSSHKLLLPLNNLVALMHTGNGYTYIDIENTPHYKLISNYYMDNKIIANEYTEYLNTYEKDIDPNKKLTEFIGLFDEIKDNQSGLFVSIKKETTSFKTKKFKIIDGLHRASIAKVLSLNEIECYIIDEINQ